MSANISFRCTAVILDLDGVITDTRHLHDRAWIQMFDEFLAKRRKESPSFDNSLRPFDPIEDYARYVDGRSRIDGIRSFLVSRRIVLPEGRESDSVETDSLWGLGNKKNGYYRELLEMDGPNVFIDSVEAIKAWRAQGIPVAVVSSSRNCEWVLQKAGIEGYFSVRVDGVVGAGLGLRGKPDPAYFLEAAHRLGVVSSDALIVEDAVAGVEAGKRGGFGLVVGMDRSGKNADELTAHGADLVVHSLLDLDVTKKRPAA
jgi:trehalose 6-phosphate phosphatase